MHARERVFRCFPIVSRVQTLSARYTSPFGTVRPLTDNDNSIQSEVHEVKEEKEKKEKKKKRHGL